MVAAKPPASDGVPVELKSLPPTGGSRDGGHETLDGATEAAAFLCATDTECDPFQQE